MNQNSRSYDSGEINYWRIQSRKLTVYVCQVATATQESEVRFLKDFRTGDSNLHPAERVATYSSGLAVNKSKVGNSTRRENCAHRLANRLYYPMCPFIISKMTQYATLQEINGNGANDFLLTVCKQLSRELQECSMHKCQYKGIP